MHPNAEAFMQMFPISDPMPPQPSPAHQRTDAVLMERARALESAFLSEMLSHAGLGRGSDAAFGGGIGEDQFASFLRQAQADVMVRRGGIGLAEQLFRAMRGGDA